MKGTFNKNINLMQLDESLKNKSPYAALIVSTTGLDNKDCSEHAPIRVILKQFEYNEELKVHTESFTFDKMVQAPQAAIDAAVSNKDNYDVFYNGGIDKNAYQNDNKEFGKDVLSASDFQKEFETAVKAVRDDDGILIVNNLDHAIKYLGKVGGQLDCSGILKEMAQAHKLLDQTDLTTEYRGTRSGFTLEDLRNSLKPVPKLSFVKDAEKMKDFQQMSKEDFLKTHTDVNERSYAITAKDVAARSEKIIGGDNRIDVINHFIAQRAREIGAYESRWMSHMRMSEAARFEQLSNEGKEKYQQSTVNEKFDTLIQTGAIVPDKILNHESEFQKLIETVEDENNKGIMIIHAASTGFEFNKPLPQKTGQPIQFGAVVYQRGNDGKIDFSQKPKGIMLNIQASTKSIMLAEKNISDPKRPYDTFKETGIDLQAYKEGVNVISVDEAVKRINDFCSTFSYADYPIVAMGGTNGSEHSFAQVCMSNITTSPMCEAPHIDFTQVIKDYAYLSANDKAYTENVMFSESEMNGKKFGLQDVAAARGEAPLNSTIKKCMFTANLIKLLEEQQNELFRSDIQVQKGNAVQIDSVANGVPISPDINKDAAPVQPVVGTSDKENTSVEEGDIFADENEEYSNIVSESEVQAESIEKTFENEVFAEMLAEQNVEITSDKTRAENADRNTADIPTARHSARTARAEGKAQTPLNRQFADEPIRRNERLNNPDKPSRYAEGEPLMRRRIVPNVPREAPAPEASSSDSNLVRLLEQALEINKTQAAQIAKQSEQITFVIAEVNKLTEKYSDTMQKLIAVMEQNAELREENMALKTNVSKDQKNLAMKSLVS